MNFLVPDFGMLLPWVAILALATVLPAIGAARRNQTAWVIVIVFLPLIGGLAWLLLGRTATPRQVG